MFPDFLCIIIYFLFSSIGITCHKVENVINHDKIFHIIYFVAHGIHIIYFYFYLS